MNTWTEVVDALSHALIMAIAHSVPIHIVSVSSHISVNSVKNIAIKGSEWEVRDITSINVSVILMTRLIPINLSCLVCVRMALLFKLFLLEICEKSFWRQCAIFLHWEFCLLKTNSKKSCCNLHVARNFRSKKKYCAK